MQILGLGKVRIMRFSGQKGDLEGVLSGSDPDARDKEEPLRLTCEEGGRGQRRGKRKKTAANMRQK